MFVLEPRSDGVYLFKQTLERVNGIIYDAVIVMSSVRRRTRFSNLKSLMRHLEDPGETQLLYWANRNNLVGWMDYVKTADARVLMMLGYTRAKDYLEYTESERRVARSQGYYSIVKELDKKLADSSEESDSSSGSLPKQQIPDSSSESDSFSAMLKQKIPDSSSESDSSSEESDSDEDWLPSPDIEQKYIQAARNADFDTLNRLDHLGHDMPVAAIDAAIECDQPMVLEWAGYPYTKRELELAVQRGSKRCYSYLNNCASCREITMMAAKHGNLEILKIMDPKDLDAVLETVLQQDHRDCLHWLKKAFKIGDRLETMKSTLQDL